MNGIQTGATASVKTSRSFGDEKMWNFIPQLFYDFLARIVPGAILIFGSALVNFGPRRVAEYIVTPPEGSKLFGFGPVIIFVLVSYLIGLLFGQLWAGLIDPLTENGRRELRKECKRKCLTRFNDLLKAIGKPKLKIRANGLPKTFVMREHLRSIELSEVSRLLKVRAERRLCQVLILGLGYLAIINLGFIIIDNVYKRVGCELVEAWILEGALAFVIVVCLSRLGRSYKHYVRGTCFTWLVNTWL